MNTRANIVLIHGAVGDQPGVRLGGDVPAEPVPPLGFRTPEALEPVLARPDVRAASALLPWEVYLTDEVNARLDGLLANAPDSHLRTGRAHSSSRLRRRELDDHDGVTVGTPAAH